MLAAGVFAGMKGKWIQCLESRQSHPCKARQFKQMIDRDLQSFRCGRYSIGGIRFKPDLVGEARGIEH